MKYRMASWDIKFLFICKYNYIKFYFNKLI